MGGVVGRRRHGCPRGHPIRPQLGASTAPTEESTLETRRGCGAPRPDRLGIPDGDWNRSAVHVPRDPVAGLGGLAVPATGGCTGRSARRAHRLMGGRQGRRAVRSWNAAREDAHAPGVQRDGRLLLVLLRRLGDGADAGPPGAGARRGGAGRAGAAADVPALRNQPVPEERGRRAGAVRAEASSAGGAARRGPTSRPHRELGVDDPAEPGLVVR
jgi:hypothetical protein